jgi:DNA-binding response OmpR family regulator
VLVVEDDEHFRRFLAVALSLAGFTVQQAPDCPAAIRVMELHAPDVVVLEPRLPGIDGFAVYERASAAPDGPIPVVVVTESSLDVSGIKAACVLRKPVSPDSVVRAVQQCLSSSQQPDAMPPAAAPRSTS